MKQYTLIVVDNNERGKTAKVVQSHYGNIVDIALNMICEHLGVESDGINLEKCNACGITDTHLNKDQGHYTLISEARTFVISFP